MTVKITCDVEDCGWLYVGPEGDGMRALGRHEATRHEAVAEADFIRDHPESRERRPAEAREPGCVCPVEFMDSWTCPVHAFDAVWGAR